MCVEVNVLLCMYWTIVQEFIVVPWYQLMSESHQLLPDHLFNCKTQGGLFNPETSEPTALGIHSIARR